MGRAVEFAAHTRTHAAQTHKEQQDKARAHTRTQAHAQRDGEVGAVGVEVEALSVVKAPEVGGDLGLQLARLAQRL